MSDNEPCAQRKSGQRVGRQLTGAWQDTIFLPLLKGRQRVDTAAFAMRRSEQGTARSPAMPFAKQGDKLGVWHVINFGCWVKNVRPA